MTKRFFFFSCPAANLPRVTPPPHQKKYIYLTRIKSRGHIIFGKVSKLSLADACGVSQPEAGLFSDNQNLAFSHVVFLNESCDCAGWHGTMWTCQMGRHMGGL